MNALSPKLAAETGIRHSVHSRRRKAAMVVQLLLSQGQKISLSDLPEDQQIALTRELGGLRVIDKSTLESVAQEFAQELEQVALAAPGTMDGALAALAGAISPASSARLKEEMARKEGGDPWKQILGLETNDLAHLMERESIEIGAVVLSKLSTGKAATLLGLLPGERARRIAFAMSQTSAVTPEAVARIGRSLVVDYCEKPALAFVAPPSQRVGAILNSSPAATRDALLDSLREDDPNFAELVRQAIFTFIDIADRLKETDVPAAIRGVSEELLSTALAYSMAKGGGHAASAEFILANISKRLAANLSETIAERATVSNTEGENAQREVVTAIKTLEDQGALTLRRKVEDDSG